MIYTSGLSEHLSELRVLLPECLLADRRRLTLALQACGGEVPADRRELEQLLFSKKIQFSWINTGSGVTNGKNT
jgi:hypothetical protein